MKDYDLVRFRATLSFGERVEVEEFTATDTIAALKRLAERSDYLRATRVLLEEW